MTTLRRHRYILNLFLTALMCLWQIGQPLQAANINWTAGSGSNFNWNDAANWSGGIPTGADDLLFGMPFPNPGTLANPNILTLNTLSEARSLTVKDDYTLNAGVLTLGAGGLYVDFAKTLILNSALSGTNGFTLAGGGTVRLGNMANNYSGATVIGNGSLVITNPAQLGADSSEVLVRLNNPVAGSVANRGFGGGSLVLDGSASGMTFTRDLSLQGTGPIGDRGAALQSFGNNTLTGNIITGGTPLAGAAGINTRLTSANGMLTIAGNLNVNGTASTTVLSLGGVNTAGASFYTLSGSLSGTAIVEKTGAGTLYLRPSSTANFDGVLRVGGSAASGQSSVRIDSLGVLGKRVITGTSAVLDMNGGVLEVRMDVPNINVSNDTAPHVYFRANSTMLVDHAIGSNAINGTAVFGSGTFEDNITVTLASRNGYGFTFGAMTVNGGDNASIFANNAAGLVTYVGNFWNNANNTDHRTLTFSGNGNSLLSGSIIASAADYNHNVVKSGAGTLTITGVATTLDGSVSVQGGALAITDFRSINNNTGVVNIGSGSTAGALIIGTGVAPTAAGLTTSKVINLAGSTGAASIYANQTGANPVIINSNFTAAGAVDNAKTLILGGSNTANNIINGIIPNNAAGGSVALSKIGAGTWVLAGVNAYTGTTSISDGTLKIQANAVTSTVLKTTNAISFVNNNVYAGATLEFVGQSLTNNVQSLGALAVDAGANTIKLTPGSGGTASLIFASAATVNDAASLNIIGIGAGNSVTLTGTATGFVNRVFIDGSDFAYSDSGVLRAPIYGDGAGTAGSDVGFYTSATALKATDTNQITGSFSTNAITIDALKMVGSHTLTLNSAQLLTIRTGAAGTDAYILATGGNSVITGGTGISVGGSGSLSIRVNGINDTLTLATSLTSGTSGGLTKSGAGKLVLAGINAQTGTVSLNEGTIQLGAAGTLSGAGVSVTSRQGTVLDLNGVTLVNAVNSWNNNGILTNSSGTAVTFTIGGTSGTGTSFGSFQETNGVISITKTGSGAQSWLGTSNYTGVTTIAGSAQVTVESLANIGSDSGIGKGNASNNAGSLIFNGTSASGLVYAGNLRNGILALGSQTMTTDRLFTLSGGGVTLSSTPATNTNNAIIWGNYGAIVHGTNQDRTMIFSGTSQGENTFNPQITDSTGFITTVTKTGTGVWKLGGLNNTYSGATTITQGILMATDGQGLSSNSNLVFDGGTLFSQGTLSRNIGTGAGEMRFALAAADTAQFSGGFLGGESKLTVNWTGTPIWGTAGFVDTRDGLMLNGSQARAQGATGSIALSEVEIAGNFSLGNAVGLAKAPAAMVTTNSSSTVNGLDTSGLVVGQTISGLNITPGSYIVSINSATQVTISANTSSTGAGTGAGIIEATTLRPIRVDDNGNTGADFASLTGIISGGAGTGIRKVGSGTLRMTGNNTYDGETNVNQGTLVVTSLGRSNVTATSSVGTTVNANQNSNAVTLGNGGTGIGILQYVGQGETSDRKIRLNSTTGNNQIHSDGVGPLILTNVVNDMSAGAKLLLLRGTNTQGNIISSVLADNGGTLGITVDGSATWILSGNNTLSGAITASGGALGIGHNNALGINAGSGYGLLTISNGSVFAHGADRTIFNPITQSATSNTIATFIGDYSLTLQGTWSDPSTTSSGRFIRNNIATGKTLTLNGDYIATAGTTSRSIGFDGSGDTILNGIFSTVSNTDFGPTYSGTGSLTLGGANTYSGKTTVTSGTLRLGADNVIPDAGVNNGLIINPGVGVTATLDMNGRTDVVRSLTATTNGTIIIDNTSASAASLTFGSNDAAVSFGGLGSYTVQNSGGGALSIFKAGNTSVTFSSAITLNHTGTTGVTGGTFTVAAPLNGTRGLSVTGTGSTLSLTGGITTPSVVTSIRVDGGGTLNLLDGTGSQFSGLSNLTLGSTGGTMTTLGLNVGDRLTVGDKLNTDLLSLINSGSLNLFTGNKITLNLTDAGLNPGQQYDLLTFAPGGFTAGVLSAADWILGATPGGFSSITLTALNDRVYITTGSLITGKLFWKGTTNSTWGGALNNWTTDKAGTTPGLTTPGQGTDVVFVSDAIAGGTVTTTLEQNFKINSLTFEASTSPANTPSSVVINPGTVATNRLEIAPQASTDGIQITAGGPAAVSITANVKLGTDQTWTVADAGSTLTVSGSLLGDGDLTKAGAGKVILSGIADPTFAVSTVTVNGGNLEITNLAALGTVVNGNVASLVLNTGGAFYYNNATATTATTSVINPITLAGGTLSAGGNTQYYTGAISITGDSTINMRDANSTTLTATARSIFLTSALTGTGQLTVDSSRTVTTNLNPIAGTLTLSNDNSGWSGALRMLAGTVTATNVNALGTGDITAALGRITFSTAGGTTFNLAQNITVNAAGGILELNADASGTPVSDMTVNLSGVITLGSVANPNNALRISQASDNFSIINITNSIVLGNNSSISYQGTSGRVLDISAVISDGAADYNLAINDELGGWAVTSQTIRLSGVNTFSGNLLVNEGRLEFYTVTNAGGAASSLGQGNAITLGTGNLSFIGTMNQSTNRPINTTGSATLTANGMLGAVISYTGAITQAANNSLTLAGTGAGVITGGITQPAGAASADLTVASGNWTFEDGNVSVADDVLINGGTVTFQDMVLTLNDDIVVSGATAVLNLNTTGVWAATSAAGTSSGLYARGGAVININADNVNGVANANQTDFIFLAEGTTTGTGTLNLNNFNITIPRLDLGAIADGYEGIILGTGTLTSTSTATDYSAGFRLFRGSISANLAGGASILKQGLGTVTLSGDNSGLTGAVAVSTRLDQGTLVLDYTTNNTTKLPTTRGLDLRGAAVTILGNSGAATTQTVASTTLSSGVGLNTITITPGTGQTATLALGAITRSASTGTLRLNLPTTNGFVTTTTANGTYGLLGSSAFATVKDGAGDTWFARNDGNGNIVSLISTAKNDTATWLAGDHVTDETTGYTGVVSSGNVNSIRFDAATANAVSLNSTGIMNIMSGGILVTDQVTAGSPGFLGGTLATGVAEFILTQDSTQTFTLSSDIRLNNAFTKTGNGGLILSGNNTYTGSTQLQGGLVQLVGGNAIGDASVVALSDDRSSTLQLLANETLGGLSGGSNSSGLNTLAQVDIGTYALTINQTTSSQSYSGNVSGTGQLIKTGSGNATLAGTMSFSGDVIVNQGTVTLGTRTISNLLNVGTVTLNSGSMILDFNSGAEVGNKIRNDAPVVMMNTGSIDGLRANHNRDDASKVEQVGVLTFLGGANTLTASASATTGSTQRAMTITAASLVRSNQSTVLVRGQNLGTLTTTGLTPLHTGRVTATAAPTLFGAGGTSGTTFSILPWAIGDTDVAGKGSSFVTYGTNGFRPLDVGSEYEQLILTGGVTVGNNLRWASATGLTLSGTTPRTLNSLLLQNTSTTDAITLNGAGASLNVQSGAFLALGTQGMTLTNFTGITTGSLNEYILHIVGTSAAGLMIEAPFTTLAASLTKSGEGTLVLKSTGSTYTGNTTINQGILEIDALNKLGNSGSGGIVINAGTLRFGAAFDASSVTITLGVPASSTVVTTTGGIFDTNGFDIVFANSVGNGGNGGLTKTGVGSLTLNALAGYSGDTVLTLGTLIIGTNNAISSGNLTINGGATLALGSNSVNVGLVTTVGAAPGLTGTGVITSSKGFVFNHTGADPVIGAVLAGSAGVLKTQAVLLTLNGMNTYSGITEVQNGGLVFNSVANVGSASALGRPMNAQDGMIRMGLTTAATSLTYTGTGHSTDRLIVLQGTTGATTLNANGTGAVAYGGVKGFTPGVKNLNLGGTSLSTINNAIGVIENGPATISLVKTDANTWVLTGANTYTGSTIIDGGILRTLVAQNMTGALQFGSTTTTATVGTLELNDASATFGSLLAQTNSASSNNLVIGAGRTLEITGNVTLGSGGATTTTLLTATGAGTFNVTNTTGTGTTFLVGGSLTNLATADFSGLSNMNVSLNTTSGILQVSSTTSTNSTGFAILNLAANSTITASALTVGGAGSYNGNAGQINQLRLGSGTNTVNVNALNIGTGSRDMGSLTFLGAGGTVVVRAADGTSAALFNMGSGSSTTGAVLPAGNRNTFDVSGHTADLLFDVVSIGTQNGRTGGMENLFAFNQGTLVMKTLTMGSKTTTGNNTNVMNLGGGSVTVGTGVAASTAMTLAANTSTGAVTATVNITGGEVSVRGNILRGNQSGAGSATGTVNLDGGDLDMNGNVIGSATNPISFIAASGTLRNVATFNGTGGLNKTTTGRLILSGVNAYTGGTTVSAGSLLVNNVTGSGTGTGNVSVVAASTLGGIGSISGSVTLNGILSPGSVDGGGTSLAGRLTVGTLTANTGSELFLQVGGASVIDPASVAAYQANPSSFVVPTAWTESYQAGVTGHDQINITGSGVQTLNTTVTISGDYLNGYTPGYGDVFHFVDWASLATDELGGTQNFVNLPVLSGGANWNTDYFSSHGIVFVVPEPSRLLLLLLGLLGLCVRRRRR